MPAAKKSAAQKPADKAPSAKASAAPHASAALPPMGAHMSIAGGTPKAIERALAVGSTAVQIFLKNNNQWKGKEISAEEAAAFRAGMEASGMAPAVAHASYLINLGSPNPELREKSIAAMVDELERAALLGVPGVVVHPGAHMGEGEQKGLATIAGSLNEIIARTAGNPAQVYLETTAGQGSSLGHRFEHLAEIIELTEVSERLAVCLDTCHVFAAGYDIRTAEGVAAMLAEFDRVVGLTRLKALHINDSKKPFASRLDRHEHIGQGMIGEAAFAALLKDPRLRTIPFLLETEKGPDLAEDRMNLDTLRRLATSPGIY